MLLRNIARLLETVITALSVSQIHGLSSLQDLNHRSEDNVLYPIQKEPRLPLHFPSLSFGSFFDRAGPVILSAGNIITIESPNFPERYPNNVKLQWEIKADSPDVSLSLNCDILGIRGNGLCRRGDRLVISDSCMTKRICTLTPMTYAQELCPDTVRIVFKSNFGMTHNGFSCVIAASSTADISNSTTPEETPPQGNCSCGIRNASPRIVGGSVTERHEFSWLVALVLSGSRVPFCGGSVYNSEWVISAAHCVFRAFPSQLEILYNLWDWRNDNTTELVRKSVHQIIIHPNFGSNSLDNDIAVIRISSPVDLETVGIQPVCLPPPTADYSGFDAVVAGWGTLEFGEDAASPDKPYEVTVPIRTQAECLASHPPGFITTNMICAGFPEGGKDACRGDSGGPLTVEVDGSHHLAGVVSWGFKCAEPGKYGVYTDVPNFVGFIRSTANTGSFC